MSWQQRKQEQQLLSVKVLAEGGTAKRAEDAEDFELCEALSARLRALPKTPAEVRAAGIATGAALGAALSRYISLAGGCPTDELPAPCAAGCAAEPPRILRNTNITPKITTAANNATIKKSAIAPPRPKCDNRAAIPKPAAMPAKGPSQREAPLGLAAAAAGAAAGVALFCAVEPVAAAGAAGF